VLSVRSLRVVVRHDSRRFAPLTRGGAQPTVSAHPARFSPDDKFSQQRVTLKKRYNLLPTQQEELVL
jgi:hypothetical protein